MPRAVCGLSLGFFPPLPQHAVLSPPLHHSFLHARLRTATLRHDADGQATLLNLLLRNYLHYNLYDQAEKLVSKSVFPEQANNNEWARYLYYTGETRGVPGGAGSSGCGRLHLWPRREPRWGSRAGCESPSVWIRSVAFPNRPQPRVDALPPSPRAHQGHSAGVLGGAEDHDERPAQGAAAHGRRLQADGERVRGAPECSRPSVPPGHGVCAPLGAGLGPAGTQALFVLQVHKLLIVVELLLGEIPDRLQFRQPSLKRSLMPYFLLTQGTTPLLRCFGAVRPASGEREASGAPHPLVGAGCGLPPVQPDAPVSFRRASPSPRERGGWSRPCPALPAVPQPLLPPSLTRSLPCVPPHPCSSCQDWKPGQVQPGP